MASQSLTLQKLYKQREVKRSHFQELFGKKQELKQKLEDIEGHIETLQDVLFRMDDKIAQLEEEEEAQNDPANDSEEPLPPVVDPKEKESATGTTTLHRSNFAMHPQEILSEEDDIIECSSVEEDLTDPLTANATSAANNPFVEPFRGFQKPAAASKSKNANSRRLTGNTNPTAAAAAAVDHTRILETLNETFRIRSFRENQLEIIQATMSGKDCFVIMRTGGGKSLLYQLPIIMERPKITLVISPLLSLIHDQQAQINDFCPGVCVSFHSGISKTEQAANWKRVRDPDQLVGMILVTPERVCKSNRLKSELQHLQAQGRFSRVVIDECHCCCQWGHDFRPDYAKLGILKRMFPNVPTLAVTATASDVVREDCCKILRLSKDHNFFRSSGDRPNLNYSIELKEGTAAKVMDKMADFIQKKHTGEAGIVYTYSRKDAENVAKQLVERGIKARAYHSDVNAKNKSKIQSDWMKDKTQVVVATIAFGLGINKPDVRFVLHHSMSKSLEAYYQESGRAGRDGEKADCVLYYSPRDMPRMLRMVYGEKSEALVWTMIEYAQNFGDDAACRKRLLYNLGELNDDPSLEVDTSSAAGRDVTDHAKIAVQVLASLKGKKVTLPMLVKEWRSQSKDIATSLSGKMLSVVECEYVIVDLLARGTILPNVKYTRYDTIVYLKCGVGARGSVTSADFKISIKLPRTEKSSRPSLSTKTRPASSSNNSSDWIERKRAHIPTKAPSTLSAKKPRPLQRKTNAGQNGQKKSKDSSEIIDICDSSDEENRKEYVGLKVCDDLLDSSEEEFEF